MNSKHPDLYVSVEIKKCDFLPPWKRNNNFNPLNHFYQLIEDSILNKIITKKILKKFILDFLSFLLFYIYLFFLFMFIFFLIFYNFILYFHISHLLYILYFLFFIYFVLYILYFIFYVSNNALYINYLYSYVKF